MLRIAAWLTVPILAGALSLALSTGTAFAESTVPTSSAVLDQGGVLNPQMTAAISAWLDSYRKRSGNRVVIVILDSLEDRTIEEQAERFLAIVTAAPDHAVVMAVAPKEQQAAIAVGDGLKSRLTPARSARILDRDVARNFAADRLVGGLLRSISSLLDVLDKSAVSPTADEVANDPLPKILRGWPLLLLFAVLVLLASTVRARFRRSAAERMGRDPSGVDANSPKEIWWNDDLSRR